MKKRIKKIRAVSKRSKFVGMSVFVLAFAGIGGLIVLRSRAAAGVCSTTSPAIIGSATYSVTAPEAAQYRLWVRMQVPDTTNGNTAATNINGVKVELDGSGTSSDQCFTVTTTSSAATSGWQWINSDATAASTPHVTSSIAAGTYTAKILGLKAGVKVDKVMLLRSDNNCTPDNTKSTGREPGDNCTTLAATANISVDNTSVSNGAGTTVRWASTNATGCSATGGTGSWAGTRATSGTFATGNLTANQTYSIQCSGIGGSSSVVSATVTVTANAPVVTLTANPTQVQSGGSTTLTWQVTNNPTSCTAGGDWSGSKTPASSGSENRTNITANRTFTLQCTGPGGTSNTATANVTVSSTPGDTQPPVVTMAATGLTIGANDTSVTVRTQKSVVWRPTVSDNSGGALTIVHRVNGAQVTLAGGGYTFGNGTSAATRNGDYQLQVVATDAAGNTTTKNLLVRLRHPDIDRNGIVNILDVGSLTRNWNSTTAAGYDLNTDGIVNILDVGSLTRNWNSTQ